MGNVVKAINEQLGIPDQAALPDSLHRGHPLADRVFKTVAQGFAIAIPDQRHVFHLCLCPAAGGVKVTQKRWAQPRTGKLVDLTRYLLGQSGLGNRIAVISELILMVMKHPGDDHVLPIGGNRLLAAVAGQFPDFPNQGRRRKDHQVEKALVPAAVDNLGFAGQRKGFGDQNHRLPGVVNLFDQAWDQSGRSCFDNADGCHQGTSLSFESVPSELISSSETVLLVLFRSAVISSW